VRRTVRGVRFVVTDLFVVGLGFDLVGAWLLARGLIAKPGIIVSRNTAYWGSNAPSGFAAAEDRTDGQFGVASLLFGFVLQALGYVLDLAGGASGEHSTGRALTALALLVIAVCVTLATWRGVRPRMLRALLAEMAHWHATSADKPPTRRPLADADQLASWAPGLGNLRQDDEDNWTYAKRIFGLSDADLMEPEPTATPSTPSGATHARADDEALHLLEGRRLAYDAAMWQAPALTLVAQAFLLSVLTNANVKPGVAVAITVAGVLMLVIVGLALWQLHDRERHFSKRIRRQTLALGHADPNRSTQRSRWHPLEWQGWRLWAVPFLAFVVTDVLALLLTHRR